MSKEKTEKSSSGTVPKKSTKNNFDQEEMIL